MTRMHGILLGLVVVLAVAWGCSQSPTGTASNSKALEARVTKLEQELKTVLAARDTAQAQAAELDKKLKSAQAYAIGVEKERDDLRTNLKSKATELEASQAKFQQLHKGLKELVGQMEMTSNPQFPAGAPASVQALPPPKGY